jgi:exonuclease III
MHGLAARTDILFLQEHWLSESQMQQLNNIHHDFMCISVSGFNNEAVLSGRPFGGCAIFWRKSLNARFKHVACDSRRIIALSMEFSGSTILLVNEYMPYENMSIVDLTDEFVSQLVNLNALLDQFTNAYVILGGDFNVDFKRSTTHTVLLCDIIEKRNLVCDSMLKAYTVDFSYNFSSSRFSTLDHFNVSSELALLHNSVSLEHSVDNTSYHDPVTIRLQLDIGHLFTSHAKVGRKPAWHKYTDKHINDYKCKLSYMLKRIDTPVSSLICTNLLCTDPDHIRTLKT